MPCTLVVLFLLKIETSHCASVLHCSLFLLNAPFAIILFNNVFHAKVILLEPLWLANFPYMCFLPIAAQRLETFAAVHSDFLFTQQFSSRPYFSTTVINLSIFLRVDPPLLTCSISLQFNLQKGTTFFDALPTNQLVINWWQVIAGNWNDGGRVVSVSFTTPTV